MTSRRVLTMTVVALAAVGMFPVVSTRSGGHAITVTQAFLLFYSGVFSLVAFTGAVVWGLIAAERIVAPRYRVLSQGVHRMFGVLGLGFLGTHIVLQILAEHAQAVDAVVPFLDTRDRLVATGLGTIAADLMVVVYAVGRLRGRFVNASRPWVWRIVHGIAYLSWPLAIIHGLTAGRPVKGSWVTISYVVCLCLVVAALLIRLISPFPAARSARRVRSEPPERAKRQDRLERPERLERPKQAERSDEVRQPAGERPRRPDGDRRRPGTEPAPTPGVRPSEPLRRQPVRRPEPVRPVRQPEPVGRPEPVRRAEPVRPVRDPRPSGPFPITDPHPSGPLPVADPRPSGPLPVTDPRTTGPMPATNLWTTGPMPAAADPRPSGPLPAADPHPSGPMPAVTDPRPNGSGRPAAPGRPRERLLIPDRPDARDRADAGERPRDWLDAVERFPLLRRVRRKPAARPIVIPDIDEVEFWANLRAETAVWIRRGRR
jgi:hypothetical protein